MAVKKKSQSAMEFLLNYGWVILIVLIIIGALSYSGVLDPKALFPEKCVFKAGFECVDYGVDRYVDDDGNFLYGSIKLKLLNSMGETVTITDISADTPEGTTNCESTTETQTLLPGKTQFVVFRCPDNFPLEGKTKFKINMDHYARDETFTKEVYGELYADVKEVKAPPSGVSIDVYPLFKVVYTGQAEYTVILTNTGSDFDTYNIEITGSGNLDMQTFENVRQGASTAPATLTVSGTAGDTIDTTLKALSTITSAEDTATVTSTFLSAPEYDFQISVSPGTQVVGGETQSADYEVSITTLKVDDTYTLSCNVNTGEAICSIDNSIEVASGETETIVMTVTHNTYTLSEVEVTAVSNGDSTTYSETVTTESPPCEFYKADPAANFKAKISNIKPDYYHNSIYFDFDNQGSDIIIDKFLITATTGEGDVTGETFKGTVEDTNVRYIRAYFDLIGEIGKDNINSIKIQPYVDGEICDVSHETSPGYYYDSELVAFWPFDEGSGTIAGDLSGNGITGTIFNGATWIDGKLGKALSFDGVDDFVRIPANANLNFNADKIITVSMWINLKEGHAPAGGEGWGTILHKQAWCGITKGGLDIRSYSPGSFSSLFVAPDGKYYSVSTPLDLHTWTHVVLTVDRNDAKIYKNGILEGTASFPDWLDMTKVIFIAKEHGWCGHPFWFEGYLDNIMMYKRALEKEEIEGIYAITR